MTPTMPPTRCAAPGCSRLTPSGRARCPEHTQRGMSAHTQWLKTHPQDVGPWSSLRTRTLQEHPTCQHPTCQSPATEVDHLVEIADGGAFLDPGNVQALCREHHERKTAIAAAARKARASVQRAARGKRAARPPRDAAWLESRGGRAEARETDDQSKPVIEQTSAEQDRQRRS